MRKGDHLGTFELLVLAALQQLGQDAYGFTIRQEIERRGGRGASIGAVHATLARLEEKELVAFRLSDPLPMQGGRARKCVRITPAGRRAFQRAMHEVLRLADGLELEGEP